MDKRDKILVVEDEESARDTLAAVLEREGVRVEACGNLASARAAMEAMRFDAALVDIMLAGRHDRSNRDGVEVLRLIQEAGEGTKALVLSGHDDHDLVGDLWQKYGAYGYVSKGRARKEGLDFLLEKIRGAVKASVAPIQTRDWNALLRSLAPGETDLGIADEILRKCSFSGGLPVLRDGLLAACRWLVPLIARGKGLVEHGNAPGLFAGDYWSRGQGCAVQLVLNGTNVDTAEVDRLFPAGADAPMYRRTKGGLTLSVLGRPDTARSDFATG